MSREDLSLSISESILGKLRSFDDSGDCVVHGSDVHQAISELGLGLSNELVADCLVDCQVYIDGHVDFSGLDKRLRRERIVFNEENEMKGRQCLTPGYSTISAVRSGDDMVNLATIQAEEHIRLFSEHRKAIQDHFDRYSLKSISEEQFIGFLISLGF